MAADFSDFILRACCVLGWALAYVVKRLHKVHISHSQQEESGADRKLCPVLARRLAQFYRASGFDTDEAGNFIWIKPAVM